MVKNCLSTYPEENENLYKEHFERYPFELSPFQKYAIEAILTENHVLVTAHTGSGKTLPAEFAIEYFVKQKKKVIYTAPIKALSNQKFYEFTHKYPHISFGILTGDIKTNPEADVLIMTTEILMNTLYNKQNGIASSMLEFDMDFDNELACVVFDEVHYVNDPERGRVWEESIMLLPQHVQMVMLSATIATPERFAKWCEVRGNTDLFKSKKIVYLASTNHRVVPLNHYSFITANSSVFKHIKDKEEQKKIKDITNKLFNMKNEDGTFNEAHFHKMRKTLELFDANKIRITRTHVLNEVCKYMKDKGMFPALFFVMSRKQVEICAQELTTPLLEEDCKLPQKVRNECNQIIRRLPNHAEYTALPEYEKIVKLLEKGVAIHHSGILPVFKEMIELLYGKGMIKIIFCTETLSIGVNFATKATVFTGISKFDGNVNRVFYSHEYTQAAGRAGRRGLDKVGHVIHLNNLFPKVDIISYRAMLSGKPQTLTSKFKVSFGFIINLLYTGNTDFTKYAKRSMVEGDIQIEIRQKKNEVAKLEKEDPSVNMKTPYDIVEEYVILEDTIRTLKNKKRKDAEKRMNEIKTQNKNIEQDKRKIKESYQLKDKINKIREEIVGMDQFLGYNVTEVVEILTMLDFVCKNEEGDLILSDKGRIASQIHESHCLVMTDIIETQEFLKLNSKQLVGLFSCFTNVSVPEEQRAIIPKCENSMTLDIVRDLTRRLDEYQQLEEHANIYTGTGYEINYDLLDYIEQWCECSNEGECRIFLQKLGGEKGIFLAEFGKAVSKILSISRELEKVAELMDRTDLLKTLREIPQLILKHVTSNQSLYV